MRNELFTKTTTGRYAPVTREDVARYCTAELTATMPGKTISSPADSAEYLQSALQMHPHEVFAVVFLDNRHRVIAFEILFQGTIDSTTVYPREVIRRAMHHNAAAIILTHNHPSGIPEPSDADKLITRRIRDAGELLDIRVLDHFVVGHGAVVSLASRGLL